MNDWRGRVAESVLNADRDVVRGKDFKGGGKGRFAQGVGVHAQMKRAVDSAGGAVFTDRL